MVTIFVEGIKVAGQILKRGTDRAVEWRDLAESLSYALSVLNNPTKEAIEALTKVAQKIAHRQTRLLEKMGGCFNDFCRPCSCWP